MELLQSRYGNSGVSTIIIGTDMASAQEQLKRNLSACC